ncbi:MAG: methyl-accepting chemotaxis protein [Methylobacterium sp.]|uniref:methyl-accepting chemotaxis protein n=1 Tax=Methylobacterium sp. TaxID=409 RepID=UPI0025EAC3B6|nr:methyl-accepting chemotaxis protein [Methylobacterium sp.]MBX9930934.1 methyl-accepting chemotaxis protein [Methylobacterium sp.]
MSIRSKILAFVTLCSLVTLLVAGISAMTLRTFNEAITETKEASQRSLNAANLNRLVTSVVVEARGIYAAKDVADAKKYAERLIKNLDAMNALLAQWGGVVPEIERPLFDKVIKGAADFTILRKETARLGTEVSPKAAADQGFNELNRANRQAFQDSIDALSASGLAQVEAIDKHTDTLYDSRLMLLIGLAIGGAICCVVVGGLVGDRMIARPLAIVSDSIRRLASGDHDLPHVQPRRDEIGAIWASMTVFANAMKESAASRASLANETVAAQERRRAEMRGLADGFQGSVGALVETLSGSASEMERTAQAMAADADQTNRHSSAVMNAANETAMNVQSVAAATEELAATANEIGMQVAQTSAAAASAVESTRRTNDRVQALAESASRIGDVVALISSIAGQTNLLALNATIEAARAGEAGRGFAVVASEVKELASQTARATDEITTQIAAIQNATRETVGAIAEIGTTIGSVHNIAVGVAAAVEEQQVATQEIARSVSDAARGTQAVTETMGQVQEAAIQAGARAAQVLGAAGGLVRQSKAMAVEVDSFVGGVRAA